MRAPPLFDNVTLTLESTDPTEGRITKYTPPGSSPTNTDNKTYLSFDSINWNSWRTVTVTGQWDNISDGDQYYAIDIRVDNRTTKDPRYRYLDPDDVSLTNLDLTDKGRFYISKASRDTDENGQKATFTVRLSSQPDDGDDNTTNCLLYTSPSPRDRTRSRMPSSA